MHYALKIYCKIRTKNSTGSNDIAKAHCEQNYMDNS